MDDEHEQKIVAFPARQTLRRQPDDLCITSRDLEAELSLVREIWSYCDELIASLDASEDTCEERLAHIQRLRLEQIFAFLKILDTKQQVRRAELAVRARLRQVRAAHEEYKAQAADTGQAEVLSLSVARIAADTTMTMVEKLIAVHRARLAEATTAEERRVEEDMIAKLTLLTPETGAPQLTEHEWRSAMQRELDDVLACSALPTDGRNRTDDQS